MSNTIWAKARYAFRSDSTENWKKINPVLLAGEHGVVTDSTIPHQREKIGDGKTPWNDLGWFHGPEGKGSTVDQTYNPESENAQSGIAIANFLFTKGKNLYNPAKNTIGKRANETGAQTDIIRSEWIPVEPSTSYVLSNQSDTPCVFTVAEISLDGTITTLHSAIKLSLIQTSDNAPAFVVITTSETAAFISFSPYSNTSNIAMSKEIMLEKGSEMTSYEPYKEYIKTELIEYDYSDLESEIEEFKVDVSEDVENMKTEVNGLLVHGKNLYNPENDVYEKRAELNTSTGQLDMGQNGVRNSEWIPVEPSTTYFISHTNTAPFTIWCAEKDIENNIITSQRFLNVDNNTNGGGVSFTTQSNTAFIKCSVMYSSNNESLPTIMIEKSSICTEYESYRENLDYKNRLPLSMQNPWIGKRLVVDGDSITHAFADAGSAHSNHYFWQFVVAKLMGMNLDISRTSPFEDSLQGAANGWRGIGGSTISNEAGCNDKDVSIVLRYDGYPDDADIVIIAGGTNDWAHGMTLIGDSDSDDITTFNGALNTLLPGLKEKYPTIPIVMMTPIKRGTRNVALNVRDADGNKMVDSNGQEIKQTQKQFVDALIEKCREYGVYCCDMWSNCRLDPNIPSMIPKYYTRLAQDGSNDLVHPDKAGQEVMGKTVAGFLKTVYP